MNDIKREVVTVCSSTKFRREILKWAWEKTKKGYLIILAPFAKEEITDVESFREELEIQHKQKIRMADIVMIFNKGGYIGTSTKEELEYAKKLGKTLWFLENEEIIK